jgi:TPR repeat protein
MSVKSMMLITISIGFASACAHTASTIPAAFNALASGVIDHTTAQVSIAGVATADSSASSGAAFEGGFGARIRSIRRGTNQSQRNLVVSNWVEAGSWNKETYYNSGTTIGFGLGGTSWFAGVSGGLQYGGYRTSAIMLPLKAHFLYVGRVSVNADAWIGQRFGDFGSSDPFVRNAMGVSASVGLAGSPRGAVSEHRRGFGLGIFTEQMDGVTVTGLSLEWQFSTANIRRGGSSTSGSEQVSPISNKEKCQGGDAAACKELSAFAKRLLEGDGVAADIPEALKLWEVACDGSYAPACTELGLTVTAGKQAELGVKYFIRGCDGGHLEACYTLGEMYDTGYHVVQDATKAVSLYTKACEGNIAGACTELGVSYANGEGVAKDLTRAMGLFERACTAGNLRGCSNLAVALYSGTNVPKDEARAVTLWTRACDGADMLACYLLGVHNIADDDASGTPSKRARAMELFEKACAANQMDACHDLGRIYWNGEFGAARDIARATKFYTKACDGKVEDACRALDIMYINGQIPFDSKGAERLTPLCKAGNERACERIKEEE